MHGNVRKDAADRFDMHFWRYNAWQHYTMQLGKTTKLPLLNDATLRLNGI